LLNLLLNSLVFSFMQNFLQLYFFLDLQSAGTI
jgi:hypothetical protein